MVALDTVSGAGAAVVEHQIEGRAPDEITEAGDIRLLQVRAINGDMGKGAIAVHGALGTGPHGEAVEVPHTWEDVEAHLDRLGLTAAAALDDLTGDAWDTADERLRFLVARVAAWAGHEPQLTRSTLCMEGPARRAGPSHVTPCFADAHTLGGASRLPGGRRVGDDHGVVMQSGARKC
ncbi:hypothetical protein OG524_04860 [Streptomyces sp. NBC_01520]|uniref:hypothetical protein n=1 Tax=Streptomyces sp. NBC_01520 TaxID=2903892 RepID=UPI00386D25FE